MDSTIWKTNLAYELSNLFKSSISRANKHVRWVMSLAFQRLTPQQPARLLEEELVNFPFWYSLEWPLWQMPLPQLRRPLVIFCFDEVNACEFIGVRDSLNFVVRCFLWRLHSGTVVSVIELETVELLPGLNLYKMKNHFPYTTPHANHFKNFPRVLDI